MKTKIKTLPALLAIITILIIWLLSSCTKRACPTYADAQPQDTIAYKVSNTEKTAGVLFLVFTIYATQNSK